MQARSAILRTVISAIAIATAGPAWATNGHVLHGSGAINASLGGAGIARAFDALGTSLNPATLVGQRNQLSISVELFAPTRSLASSVDAGAFGGQAGPPSDMAGRTRSDSPLSVLPALGGTYMLDTEWRPITVGLVMQGIAGFGVDYDPSSFSDGEPNPILTEQPPNGYGFGRIFSDYKLMTFKLSAAAPITDKFAFGVAIVPAFSQLQNDPFPATTPVDDPNDGDEFPTYPDTGFSTAFGIGFQLGLTYDVSDWATVGLNYSSPLWFNNFRWSVSDEGGTERQIHFNLDYPAIAGLGTAIELSDSTVWVTDVRRIFYADTDGFDRQGFGMDAAVQGFGWKNVWVVGTGIQHAVCESLKVRIGYNYNTPAIADSNTFFNVSAPAVPLHRITAGLGWDVTDSWQVNATYYHAFEETIRGRFIHPQFGEIEGTEVNSRMYEDSFAIQVVRFFGD